MGPTVSSELLSGNTPFRLTLPNVGFRPTIPHNPAGILIEPPVSVPRDPMHNPPETAAADPLLDPPVIFMVFQGLWQSPNTEFLPVVPKANSCMLSLPIITAPACSNLSTTVALNVGMKLLYF